MQYADGANFFMIHGIYQRVRRPGVEGAGLQISFCTPRTGQPFKETGCKLTMPWTSFVWFD
jgi:hypothetical protein